MEIIRKGDLRKIEKPVEFTCDRCGCIFIAKEGEYGFAPSIAQQRGEATYTCKCPTCKHEVWK